MSTLQTIIYILSLVYKYEAKFFYKMSLGDSDVKKIETVL